MNIIVPLAGPNMLLPDGSLKCCQKVNGVPLLRATLETRPWHNNSLNYFFILEDSPETRTFANGDLVDWYPEAKVTFISQQAQGAALSVLGGLCMVQQNEEPILVDLADIIYETDANPKEILESKDKIGAVAFTFLSTSSEYSYLSFDKDNKFVEAREKVVISEHASVGTYVFKNYAIYLLCLSWYLSIGKRYRYNDLFFVCPLLNAIRHYDLDVMNYKVKKIFDVKID